MLKMIKVQTSEDMFLGKEILQNAIYVNNNGVKYVQFENFLKHKDILTHCFTTRIGGVSANEYSTLNLGFNKMDNRENVLENYKRVAHCIGIEIKDMVLSNQIHDNKVRTIDESDRGKGIIRESDIIGYDGLITNIPGVAIVTFYADCVPVFFFDPNKRVISISHSGWRGTMKEIVSETVSKMNTEYGSNPEDLEVVIGPSIGKCCFEVGEDVVTEFSENLRWSRKFCDRAEKANKWLINLQGIIEQSLMNSKVKKKKIFISNICTKCNKDVFFSHRGDAGKTGSMAGIMQLL
jgi:YfiH family protein